MPSKEVFYELVYSINYNTQALKSDTLWYTNPGTNTTGFNTRPGGEMSDDGESYYLTACYKFKTSTFADSTNAYYLNLTTYS